MPTPVTEKPVESVSLPDPVPHPAELTVFDFMTAMQRGEDEKIRTFLTSTARKAGEEEDFPFSCSASDTATFTIDKTVLQGDSTALVSTTWTDVDSDGQKESKIIWTVEQTDEGWRISGAFVTLFEYQPPVQINFEDPESIRKVLAEAEAMEKQRLGGAPSIEENN